MDSYLKNVDEGNTYVMLVPDGGKNVTVFQRKYEYGLLFEREKSIIL